MSFIIIKAYNLLRIKLIDRNVVPKKTKSHCLPGSGLNWDYIIKYWFFYLQYYSYSSRFIEFKIFSSFYKYK